MTAVYGVIASLLSAVVACTQKAPAELSPELREHLKAERFSAVTAVRGMPLGVRGELQTLFGSQRFEIAQDIADPGGKFQGSGPAGEAGLPLRRLIGAECSLDHCFVYYERGGNAVTLHVALFQWTPEGTRLESGGLLQKRLPSITEARNALLTGGVKTAAAFW